MSGGSLDYLYVKVSDAASEIEFESGFCSCDSTPSHRRAFAKHLFLVAKALRSIEWNMSCDGDGDERANIEACINKSAVIEAAIDRAEVAKSELEKVIAAIKKADTID
jgi:hypothetical protein